MGMIVGVIQARLGSKRLPGKVLAEIGGRPLIEWTMAAVRPVVDRLVVAIPRGVENDPLAAFLCGKVVVHRGLADDVLTRCWDAVAPYAPDIVLRQTADNPFCLTEVMRGQIARIGQYDYVGIAGWPLGIAGEAMTFAALTEAYWNAVTDYDREHVTPWIAEMYGCWQLRNKNGYGSINDRWTVDDESDLAFARSVYDQLYASNPLFGFEAMIRAGYCGPLREAVSA